ncbi:MAG: aminomethyl-transferring glycine dehydrogenase subunit GcvPB [Parachlamydiales bacterium]
MLTAFEKSQKGQRSYSLPKEDSAWTNYHPPHNLLRETPPPLPEISEIDLTRHFSQLARRNMGIDTNFYPLGSCTMKLNPRVNEWCASLPSFQRSHPLAPSDTVQGNLYVIYHLLQLLCQITGMHTGSLSPNAGAQGELTGIKMIAAFHAHNNDSGRNEMLVPDNAHGTNPATAAMVGYKIIVLHTTPDGDIDLEQLRSLAGPKTAGLMLTNPNTLGLFSSKILEIANIVHSAGGLLYYDGANLNAILEIARPGQMGFDVMHLNLHKTFSTPHGGGGPGSGPVLCNEKLSPFLPLPLIHKSNDSFLPVPSSPLSIGRIASFFGNFAIYLRAYLYSILHGRYGLRRIAENAVLNANYLKKLLGNLFTDPYPQHFCMHEFVLQADKFPNIKALDIAKRLLDYNFHAPTIYFPLIIKECLLIEPTESESKNTLDSFLSAVLAIHTECTQNPELLKNAPLLQPVSRLNEVQAARHPKLTTFH